MNPNIKKLLENCLELYEDFRHTDWISSEDDAISAAVNFPNGMEEVVSEYLRKEQLPETESPADIQVANEEFGEWSCHPADFPIREIHLDHMGKVGVRVATSCDELLHVICDNEKLGLITNISAGVLTIVLSESLESRIPIPDMLEFDLESFRNLFKKICRKYTGFSETGSLTLLLPSSLCPALRIRTTRGDITITSMALEQLDISSASGDVEIDSSAVQNELCVSSSSGDITVSDTHAKQMELSSNCSDIEVRNCIVKESMELNTISGDVCVRLPQDTHPDVSCNTISGDICNHAGSVPGAPVTVKISTVSGDVEIN